MNSYPEVVARIADDYVARVRFQLGQVPAAERDEFLREIRSHLYEAYQQAPGEDEVAKILAVLRNFGEPSEVVADRLPTAMVRTGAKRNLPLYVIGGILIGLFGVPLGFGGVAVLIGVLIALVGVVASFYIAAGAILLSGALVFLLGMARIYHPELWERLVKLGVIQLNGTPVETLGQFSPAGEGLLLIFAGAAMALGGLGMLWLGRYLLRGLRFLCDLMLDWIRRGAQAARRKLNHDKYPGPRQAAQHTRVNAI